MKVSNLTLQNTPTYTFTTRYVPDTWGRQLQMTYPDGEVLTTAYDSGGLAKSVTGVKSGATYPYVKRFEYDRFGHHRFMGFGQLFERPSKLFRARVAHGDRYIAQKARVAGAADRTRPEDIAKLLFGKLR